MQKYVRCLVIAIGLMPTVALAHIGDHGSLSMAGAIMHFLSQPDHWLGLAMAIALIPVVKYLARFFQ